MDGGAWQAKVHGVAKSQTRLSSFISLHFIYVYIEFPCSSAGKESTCNAGDPSLIPGLENPLRKGARHTQRRDQASGVSPDILEHLPPKKPESAYFIALCSHL